MEAAVPSRAGSIRPSSPSDETGAGSFVPREPAPPLSPSNHPATTLDRAEDLPPAWDESFAGAKDALVEAFVGTYSYSLQQTLYAMGERVLRNRPELAEVRLALPNKHHYLVDLSPFELANPQEVFIAGDRPYGLIEGTVTRDDAPPASAEWYL
jgi:hypothetical protein